MKESSLVSLNSIQASVTLCGSQRVKSLATRMAPKIEVVTKLKRSKPKEASRDTRPHPSVSGTIRA